jgi:uncharacterized glyoxalase superfamily protein PhnB
VTEDLVRGWAPVYPHIHYREPAEAIAWLTRVFGFRERVRMTGPDGTFITSKLETPGGGLVMVAGSSPEFTEWIQERVPGFREQQDRPWPNLSHTTTVMVSDVDRHHEHAKAEGATMLMSPMDQPWGLRSYATIDLEGHQWEFSEELQLLDPEAWGATRIEDS